MRMLAAGIIIIVILSVAHTTTDAFSFTVQSSSSTTTRHSYDLEGNQQQKRHSMYTCAALDLDGTLLNSKHQLSDQTKDTLRRLTANGFRVMICTGRAISTVYEHILDLNLELPVVCSNGAQGLICSPRTTGTTTTTTGTIREVQSNILFSLSVPQSAVQTAIEEAKKMELVVQYYVGDGVYANPIDVPWQKDLCHKYTVLTGSKTIYVTDEFAGAMREGLPSKLLILCPKDRQDDMIAHFEQVFKDVPERPHLVRGYLGWFMEILPPNVNKGNGLKLICSHLNICLKDVIAFGDGDNDLEFIQQAGWGIVMKNGRQVVKEVADEVIDLTNDEDGVVKTLEAMEVRSELCMLK